jgi:hypothetical protein
MYLIGIGSSNVLFLKSSTLFQFKVYHFSLREKEREKISKGLAIETAKPGFYFL